MKYNVIIKKCDDPAKVGSIAQAIARWSESAPQAVADMLAKKSICVREFVDEQEARRVRDHFTPCGAEIVLADVSKNPGLGEISFGFDVEEGEEEGGRLLSEKEYSEILKSRKDIFIIEKENRLRNLEIISMVVGLSFGIWLSSVEAVKVTTDYINEKKVEQRSAKMLKDKDLPQNQKKIEEEKKAKEKEKAKKDEKKGIEKAKGTKARGGGGDPRQRLAKQGVLGLLGGAIKGKGVADADITGKGGFANNIDAMLSGVNGLKSGGGTGSGRLAAAGMGFGNGYGSGFGGGGGGGGIDDLIGSLMGGGGGGGGGKEPNLQLKRHEIAQNALKSPEFLNGNVLTGGRTKASINQVVMQNMPALKYAYNKRLRDKPGLRGQIKIKFAIDEFGKVVYCEVVESTIEDPELETAIKDKIKRWVFDKIDKPGDITEVVYPFVFSQ